MSLENYKSQIDRVDFKSDRKEDKNDLTARALAKVKLHEMYSELNKGTISEKDFDHFFARIKEIMQKQDADINRINSEFERAKNDIVANSAMLLKEGKQETIATGLVKKLLYLPFGIEERLQSNNDFQNYVKGAIDELLALPEVLELIVSNSQARRQLVESLKNLSWEQIKDSFKISTENSYEAGRASVFIILLASGIWGLLRGAGSVLSVAAGRILPWSAVAAAQLERGVRIDASKKLSQVNGSASATPGTTSEKTRNGSQNKEKPKKQKIEKQKNLKHKESAKQSQKLNTGELEGQSNDQSQKQSYEKLQIPGDKNSQNLNNEKLEGVSSKQSQSLHDDKTQELDKQTLQKEQYEIKENFSFDYEELKRCVLNYSENKERFILPSGSEYFGDNSVEIEGLSNTKTGFAIRKGRKDFRINIDRYGNFVTLDTTWIDYHEIEEKAIPIKSGKIKMTGNKFDLSDAL